MPGTTLTLRMIALTTLLLALGGAGGLVAQALHLPMPFMLGSLAVAALAVGLFQHGQLRDYRFPMRFRTFFIGLIGVMIGTQVRPELISEAGDLVLTLSALAVFVALAHGGNFLIFRRLGGYSRATAYYAGTPGGLMESLVMGERAGADERLRALAKRMGAEFRTADDPREMIDAVAEIDGPVLIDSPAVNPFELDDLDMTLAFADSARAEIIYVFDAGLTPEDAEDAASLFASIGASRCIPVKLDTSRRLGAILGVGETGLAFAQISSTPFIGGGLAPATPLRLARVLIEDRDTPFEEADQ